MGTNLQVPRNTTIWVGTPHIYHSTVIVWVLREHLLKVTTTPPLVTEMVKYAKYTSVGMAILGTNVSVLTRPTYSLLLQIHSPAQHVYSMLRYQLL